jgi:hypothetical protein
MRKLLTEEEVSAIAHGESGRRIDPDGLTNAIKDQMKK